jgi:mRNA interferase RelE/StbE
MVKLRIPDYLVKSIRTLHPEIKRKIKSALKSILEKPYSGKLLKEELGGLRSIRVSKFRITYRLEVKNEIQIIAIGPRNTIYEETYRLIKKEKAARDKNP